MNCPRLPSLAEQREWVRDRASSLERIAQLRAELADVLEEMAVQTLAQKVQGPV